ncbi:ABC transporter ATP-binding protein [Croceicoccus gelatinilyticus]|uniref:ABC transporter ATP-binding protein n=1 Tax=Croceicoccus gelatinilyticus TaxID=2835536 RepID=UPI001BCB131A|nr:ABC transporter ATP-binding protein [Croceicoccus gelatinilyticus]MBS7668360.1 ABC transporter ATP-binding protein [Croceicoccus gelatinilyticus]
MLSARDLVVKRSGRTVVESASLVLEPGVLTAICGPNGAGKSSLLAALAGLLPIASGEVALGDRQVAAIPAREKARMIGFLPQQADVAWDISVETLVALGRLPWRSVPGRPARASREADSKAVASAMAAMELEALAHRPVSQLSGGEKARAAMGRVLAGEPDWILADEPLANLDLSHQQALSASLKREAGKGRGVVVVMHDLAAAMNHAERVIVIENGHIVADGAPEQALSREVIEAVWQVPCRWLGKAGARALAMGPADAET